MGKYLLLIAGILVVYWLARSHARRRAQSGRLDERAAESMVRCAECGIHLPRGESLIVRGQFYCCADHQHRHDPTD